MPDADLFASLPGVGEHLTPRLLLSFGKERSRFESAQALMQYAGIALVTEQSGKKNWVPWQASPEKGFSLRRELARWSCPKFCARALWNGQSSRGNIHSEQRHFMTIEKRKGKTHQEAIQALTFQ